MKNEINADDAQPILHSSFFTLHLKIKEPIPGLEPGTYSLRMNCSTN